MRLPKSFLVTYTFFALEWLFGYSLENCNSAYVFGAPLITYRIYTHRPFAGHFEDM